MTVKELMDKIGDAVMGLPPDLAEVKVNGVSVERIEIGNFDVNIISEDADE